LRALHLLPFFAIASQSNAMAPKGMKRPATSGIESAKKRVKPVVEGLKAADGEFPAPMLISMLEFSLGEFKEKRTQMQIEAVSMIADALKSAEKALEAKVAEAQKKADAAYPEKDERLKVEAKAGEAISGLKAAVEAATGEEKKAEEESDAAATALKAAQAEQKSGDKEYKASAAKKEKVVSMQAEAYVPLKETAMKDSEMKKKVKLLMTVGKEFSFDSSLLESAPAALAKKPEERGEFDKTILGHMDTQFEKCLEALSAEISGLEPGKQEREAKVAAAKSVADAAAAKLGAATTAVKDAKDALKAGEKALKAATLSVKNWLPDVKVMFDSLDEATEELKTFKEGPLQTFETLKDLETPPPPPEEPEEPEEPEPAAADAAPAEPEAPAAEDAGAAAPAA